MAKANKAKLYQWPPPVYVARFAGGEECRMSVSSTIKGQYGFERARGIICAVIGNERGRAAALRDLGATLRATDKTYGPTPLQGDIRGVMLAEYPAAGDLIAGHFEHDGAIVRDPLFLPTEVTQAKAKADPLARVLAAIGKLSADQRDAVLAALVPIAGFEGDRIAA